MIAILLRIVFVVAIVALPIGVLVLVQLAFLPYHSSGITWSHRCFLSCDIVLVWLFFLIRPRTRATAHENHIWLWCISIFLLISISLALLAYSLSIATIPDECVPGIGLLERFREKFAPHRNITVTNRIISSQEPAAELFSLREPGEDFSPEVVWRRFSQGAIFLNRNLQCADFSGSQLVNADFRGAKLKGARFLGSVLQGANFAPLEAVDVRLPKEKISDPPAILHRYSEKELTPSDLSDTDFTGANLREAIFRSAAMSGARFDNADLRLADLSFANLDEARLIEAHLFAADLSFSSLRGTIFWKAQLQGATLKLAKAEFSSFEGAVLDGAELSDIDAEGSDFSNSSLRGVTGLPIQGVNFRHADMTHTVFCGKYLYPAYVDLKYAKYDSTESLAAPEEFEKGLSEHPAKDVMERLKKTHSVNTCILEEANFLNPEFFDSRLMYTEKRALSWPPSMDEAQFYNDQASFLVDVACSRDRSVQLALIRRIHERLTVDPEDLAAKTLAVRLAQKLSDSQCPNDLEDSVKAGVLQDAYSSP